MRSVSKAHESQKVRYITFTFRNFVYHYRVFISVSRATVISKPRVESLSNASSFRTSVSQLGSHPYGRKHHPKMTAPSRGEDYRVYDQQPPATALKVVACIWLSALSSRDARSATRKYYVQVFLSSFTTSSRKHVVSVSAKMKKTG